MENEVCSSDTSVAKEKVCLVCGDKALGYNFNAITCESCKAFFRRNALKDKEFKCPFNKKCEINTITRRFCQLCRLIKCFDVGMKKEYIMSENDKKEKRKMIEFKRTKTSTKVEEATLDETSSDPDFPVKRIKVGENIDAMKVTPGNLKSYQVSPNHVMNEQKMPYPSPSMEEPSSPVGAAVTESRSPNIYFNANRSRPVEVYQISRTADSESMHQQRHFDSIIIKNVLSADYNREFSTDVVDCRIVGRKEQDCVTPTITSSRSQSPPQRPMPILSSLVGDNVESPERSKWYHPDVAEEVLRDIPNRNHRTESANSIDSILSEAIKLEYEAYSSMNPRINSRELNEAERAKLNELIVANKALLAPLDDDASCMVTPEGVCKGDLGLKPMLVDVLNLTAIAIRRLIKMSKKVNAFKNMCQEDQVALLKGGCTEMMILRSAMTYDSDRGSWKIPHSKESLMNIKVEVLKEAGGKVFEEHQRFLQTFDPRWRNDENIMLILSAITLFTPDRPRVVHYDVIKLEQNSYYYLLRRYLESTYPGCEARSTFLKLIHKIAELHRLNEDHVRVYMELNPEDVEPLLIEIFDLKTPLRGDLR